MQGFGADSADFGADLTVIDSKSEEGNTGGNLQSDSDASQV